MRRKYILIGIILLSMLLLAACGKEKPLADRVIENLEDCMGAREMTEEEYEEIKRRYELYPIDYRKSLRKENAYLLVEENDLGNVNIDLSYYLKEDVEVNNAILYKYENEIEDKKSYMTVFLYEFISEENAAKYVAFLQSVWGTYYTVVKENGKALVVYPEDRKMGRIERSCYFYQSIVSEKNDMSIDSVYCFWEENYVIEVEYDGPECSKLYPKFKKFLKKMKFEGLNDIELEYAEPQSAEE